MALTLYYVDPNLGNDSTGNGTIGTPWKTTQKALNTISQGAGGDQINIKAGTADVLTATLSLTTYGTPSSTKPLVFRGFTSAANDGGIGDISGGGSFQIISEASKACISFVDLHLHNVGGHVAISMMGTNNSVIHCEVDTNSGGNELIDLNATNGICIGCYLHDATFYCATGNGLLFNRVEMSNSGSAVEALRATGVCAYNTIALTTSGNSLIGIIDGQSSWIFGNSIWSNAGTGSGISTANAGSAHFDNIIEGFSGTGGKGIAGSVFAVICGNNFFRNCATITGYTGTSAYMPADTTLASEPFNNPTGSPPDLSLSAAGITALKGRAWVGAYYGTPFTSYRDAGAVQHQDSAAGGVCAAAQNYGQAGVQLG